METTECFFCSDSLCNVAFLLDVRLHKKNKIRTDFPCINFSQRMYARQQKFHGDQNCVHGVVANYRVTLEWLAMTILVQEHSEFFDENFLKTSEICSLKKMPK